MKKPSLFKLICSLLILCMSASFLLVACNGDADADNAKNNGDGQTQDGQPLLNIGIIADVHVLAEAVCPDVSVEKMQNYKYQRQVLRMMECSEAILKAAVDRLIELQVDVAFVLGDLTERGDMLSLEVVRDQCARLEAAGIPTFVANGLMDTGISPVYAFTTDNQTPYTTGITDESYVQTMQNFGYSEAISCDANSLSYIADIPNTDYRVMMIDVPEFTDTARPNDDGSTRTHLIDAQSEPLSEGQLDWIRTNLADARKYNKEVIVISSVPVNETPISYFSSLVQGAYISFYEGATLEDLFTTYGVKYFFNGHVHMDGTLEVETSHGTLVEESTACLVSYPSTIKKFTICDNSYKIEKTTITNFKEEYLSSYISAEDKAQITGNFAEYSKQYILNRFKDLQHHSLSSSSKNGNPLALSLMIELTIYPTGNAEADALLEQIDADCTSFMTDVNDLPLYGEGNTVEGLCKDCGLTPPKSDTLAGKTVLDYIFDLFLRMSDGSYIEGNEFDVQMMTCVLGAGLFTAADVDFLARISEVNNLIVPGDMHVIMNNLMYTGTAKITDGDFVASVVSLFYPFINKNIPWLKLDKLTNADAILSAISMVIPVVTSQIPEIALFAGVNGDFETTYISLSKGEIYLDALIKDMVLPVMVRTVLSI